ncbi:HEPN domain-containing protein [Candidatus Bathyarchaeota archaeon]|nr:MAG: HEPN domain-containing protein [Candidatus Bathyarchaeota archaeon]
MMEENVKIRIKEELETAKRRLEAAKLLFEKDMIEDAVNRAYYAFFHAAKAMLNVLGYDAKTHSGLISEFGLRIIKTELLDKKFGQYFRRAFEMRESSDYEIGIIFSEEEVETLIKNADEFLKKAKEFIEEKL